MSQDVTQWLDEIKSLQQQLARSQSDRDAALASAEQWRGLYNTEAQQRRTDAKLAQQTIESLKAEIQQLQEGHSHPDAGDRSGLKQQLQKLPPDQLTAKVLEVMLERDRYQVDISSLSEALQAEQVAHLKTRQTLTTALGDTMDRLKATRAALLGGEGATKQTQNSPQSQTSSQSYQIPASSKNPLLQLPPINPDRDPA